MRLFRLKNAGLFSWWVIAPTLDAAIDYSFQKQRAKAKKNIVLVGDQTEDYLGEALPSGRASLRTLLAGSMQGFAAIRHDGRSTWIMSSPEPVTWILSSSEPISPESSA